MVLASSNQINIYSENRNVSPNIMLDSNSVTASIVNITTTSDVSTSYSDDYETIDLPSNQSDKNIIEYNISDTIPSFTSLLSRLPPQGWSYCINFVFK